MEEVKEKIDEKNMVNKVGLVEAGQSKEEVEQLQQKNSDEALIESEREKTDHPRGWDSNILKKMDIKVWSYLEEYEKEKDEIHSAIKNVLESGVLILGDHVKRFEDKFSNYCGCKYGIGVKNGTDALFLSLKALDIGPGDEVICVANTAVPTVAAITATGATTKFVDINPETCLMNIFKLKDAITEKTKCILPVHLYGQCVDMDKVKEMADEFGLKIVEDCAQAHGATYKGRKAGSMSDVATFSFYPSKVLGTFGDGGMVVTNNETLYERIKGLRMYGMRRKYFSIESGYNSRLDELHAAILLKKFAHLDEYIRKRQEIARRYGKLLTDTSLILPKTAENNTQVYYVYVCHHPKRDEIIAKLKERGILLNISYEWPIHIMDGYKYLGYKEGDLPHTEASCKNVFSLPMYPELSYEKQQKVCDALHDVLREIE